MTHGFSQDDTDYGKTQTHVPRTSFGPPNPRLRSVAVLTPVTGCLTELVRIEQPVFVIGRRKGVDAVLLDRSVSREHARIVQRGDEYVLEDLDSSHGTFVDNVPIISCLLRDGDMIQIGTNVFYFDRMLEPYNS